MPAGDELYLRRVVQRIEHREVTLSRHAKRKINAMYLQLIDENLSAAAKIAHDNRSNP